MALGNEFYKRDIFQLVDVSFNSHNNMTYTYVAHVKQNVKVGDWIIVPTGVPSNVFTHDAAYDHTKTVKVKAVRSSSEIGKQTFMVRPIVCVIDQKIYNKVSAARHKKHS